MIWRVVIAAAIWLLVFLALASAISKAIWPPEQQVQVDGGGIAYAAQFRPKAKPLIIRPAPKSHRLKNSMEPFRRFEFDQRAIA